MSAIDTKSSAIISLNPFNPATGMKLRTILLAISAAPSQIPSGENVILTAEWDTILSIDTNYVTLTNDAQGRQGLITFVNEQSNIDVNVAFDFAKTGNVSANSTIFGRRMINGVQSGTTVEKDMQNFEQKDNFVDSFGLTLSANDTIAYEFAYLDDESGLLQNLTVPTGFDPVPCTAIRISRWEKA